MQRCRVWLMCLLLLPVLAGCSPSSGEKQIFPICMSMDRLEDGRMQLAVQVSSMGKEDEYVVFSAAGDSFQQSLEILGASMPYPLHFGQLRLCLISWQLAGDMELRTLLEPVARLSTISPQVTAMVVMGNAAEAMAAQKPDLGVRLSTYLDQLMARLRQEKLMPQESMQQALHMLDSGYQSPLLGLCAVNADMQPKQQPSGQQSGAGEAAGAKDAQPAFQQTDSIAIGEPSPGADLPPALTAGTLPRQGGNPVEYTGCAVVGGGRITGVLTATETRLAAQLLEGAKVTQVTETGATIAIPAAIPLEDAAALVTKLQLLECDALGLGAKAARLCSTMDAFNQTSLVEKLPRMHLTITYK